MRPSPTDHPFDPIEPDLPSHFCAVFGRPATDAELARYRRARAWIELRVPPRRRRLADVVVRL